MSFKIKKIQSQLTLCALTQAIADRLGNSRFNARVTFSDKLVEVHDVRLKTSKDYCGNHPFSCPVRPGGHRPHHKLSYLEGLDWVEFNDTLNNVLDELEVSAHVASSRCVIRKGTTRRMEYDGHKLGNNIDSDWDKDSNVYEDYVGKPHPRAVYPEGTPGLYTI